MSNKKDSTTHKYIITEKGSLGILALGDIGLREWRKMKKGVKKK